MVDEWFRDLERDIAQALSTTDSGSVATRVDSVVGRGTSWAEALADISWDDGEVLAIGTSSSAISQFFLGSHASKIVRSSSVPVFLVPRSLTGAEPGRGPNALSVERGRGDERAIDR